MSKRVRKKYSPMTKFRDTAHLVASRYVLAGVADMDKAVFVYGEKMTPVRLSSSTARMINDIRHHWSVVCCVAGRYKNGKVWVRYDQANATIQATAHEVSPLVTEFVDEFFKQQDPNSRIARWWLATPKFDHWFTAEQIIMPAVNANIFRSFLTKHENETTKYPNNCPEEKGERLTPDEFKAWWDVSRSPKSQLQELWLEETTDGV